MGAYQLRIYTLASAEAAAEYEEIWRRHITSLSVCGLYVHGIWRPLDDTNRLFALVSVADGDDLDKAGEAYMASPGFLADFEHLEGGFESYKHKILGVETTVLKPTKASPMR